MSLKLQSKTLHILHRTSVVMFSPLVIFETEDVDIPNNAIKSFLEVVEKEKYFIQKKERFDEANKFYLKMMDEDDDGLFINDIMKGETNPQWHLYCII